jgi:hypothetical protein
LRGYRGAANTPAGFCPPCTPRVLHQSIGEIPNVLRRRDPTGGFEMMPESQLRAGHEQTRYRFRPVILIGSITSLRFRFPGAEVSASCRSRSRLRASRTMAGRTAQDIQTRLNFENLLLGEHLRSFIQSEIHSIKPSQRTRFL